MIGVTHHVNPYTPLSPSDCTLYTCGTSRGRAVAARRAHNPEVVGSNPTPATTFLDLFRQVVSIVGVAA
jgi:hypothetical protein